MAQDFTTTGLLASIKRRGMLPSTSETLSNSDFLELATEELQTYVMEALLAAGEDYALDDYDISTTASTSSYALPQRASASLIRSVLYNSGNGTYAPLQRITPERVASFSSTSAHPEAFVLEDDRIILVPTPSSTGTLRLKHPRRPGKLVTTSAVATIASIDAGRTVITTSSTIPSSFTTGLLVDVVDEKPGFGTLALESTTTATTSGTTITLTTALSSTVTAGDYVCLAGESPVPQIPVELHPLLAQRTAAVALRALGDSKANQADAAVERMRALAVSMLNPRTKGSPQYIINRNGPGFRR